jgi:hypothetical protein
VSTPSLPNQAWMYWEDVPGRPRPPYLDLCLDTVRHQATGVELTVTGRDSIFEYVPEIDRGIWERLPGPNFRSDYARTRLLHRYGGVWLDFDLIAIRPLTELLAPLAQSDVLGWGREDQGRFYAGLCASRPGARFVERWLEAQDETLARAARDDQGLPWAALAQDITQPLAAELGYRAWAMQTIAPVMWWEWRRFTSRLDSPRRILDLRPYTVMLFSKVMDPWFEPLGASEILAGPTLLSRLIRIALGESTVEDEEARIGRLAPLSRLRFSRAGQEVEKQYRWRLRGLPRTEV